MLCTATFALISLTVTFYIAEQFVLQPFLQPREIVCDICGGLVDLPGIILSFYSNSL